MTDEQKQALTEYIHSVVSTIRMQHITEEKVLHYLEVECLTWLWDRRIAIQDNPTLDWMRSMIRQAVQEEEKKGT